MPYPLEHSRCKRGTSLPTGRTRRRSRRYLLPTSLLALIVASRLATDGDPPTCLALPLLSAIVFVAATLGAARLSPWPRLVAGAVSCRALGLATALAARRRNAALFDRLATLCCRGDFPERQDRVAVLVGFVARGAGLSRSEQRLLATASTLHRTGFVSLPPMAGMDYESWVRLAADIAHRLLSGPTPLHRAATEMACGHDESWDGVGFPSGLAGEAIPFSARVLQVGLALDALLPRTGRQPDRVALTAITARIAAEAGRTLDPSLAILPLRDVARLAGLLASLPMPPDQCRLPGFSRLRGARAERGPGPMLTPA